MKHYFQDPATFSDDELKCLSDELYDEYTCYHAYNDDSPGWTDDEAEARYEALSRELRVRRETRMSPEERKRNQLFLSAVTQVSLDALRANFCFARLNAAEFEYRFGRDCGNDAKISKRE